jgi:hypothetical protein
MSPGVQSRDDTSVGGGHDQRDIEIYPELKIKTLPALLAVLRQPGPRRDVYEQETGA